MMEGYNEKEVLALLQDESTRKDAFAMIVKYYSEQLYWQIRRIVLNHDDADDLLQNTFIKAWMNIEYFRGDAKLSTWLYRIALNECLTFTSKQQSSISLDEYIETKADELADDPFFTGDEIQLIFQKALMTLPEKQRIVFNMRYYDNMPYEDMSQIFGTSVGALKSSYHIAVKKIEDYVRNHSN